MKDLLLGNQTLETMLVMMASGTVLYLLRQLPIRLFNAFVWAATVRLTITGDDEVFDHVSEWLASHAYATRARTLKLSTGRTGTDRWSLAPGFGTHVFWDDGLVILSRSFDEKASASGWQIRPKERMTITIIGRHQGRLRAMIDQANAKRISQDAVGVRIWTSGWWARLHSKGKRSLDTVFLPAEQKRAIVEGIQWFIDNPAWFAAKGIPYRYGVLFFGPPGTGKTTLVMALSSHFNRPIYILNLATVSNDNELLQAFMSVAKGAIVLIEDVDAAQATGERAPVAKGDDSEAAAIAAATAAAAAPKVTLSGLLNAIDGVAASEDRILFMTTNHVGKLDEALVRKARIDAKYEICPLPPEQVSEMARAFFPGQPDAIREADELARAALPLPAAEWQSRFAEMEKARRESSERRAA